MKKTERRRAVDPAWCGIGPNAHSFDTDEALDLLESIEDIKALLEQNKPAEVTQVDQIL